MVAFLDEHGFLKQRRLPDQRLIALDPLTFGRVRLGIGPKPPLEDAQFFYNSWEFPNAERALVALDSWNPDESSEPDGWDRHPDTGRYRIYGAKHLEYIKFDGTTDEQVMHAIKVQGSDRIIKDVHDDSYIVGFSFPEGTKCFTIVSLSTTCPHTSACMWHDRVFHYLDRCVVLPMPDSYNVSVATVLRRLTE